MSTSSDRFHRIYFPEFDWYIEAIGQHGVREVTIKLEYALLDRSDILIRYVLYSGEDILGRTLLFRCMSAYWLTENEADTGDTPFFESETGVNFLSCVDLAQGLKENCPFLAVIFTACNIDAVRT